MQPPMDYVIDYYNSRKHMRFPGETAFTYANLGRVDGHAVLNAGCGPQFFDHALRFKTIPDIYAGIDVSAATMEFLQSGLDPRMVDARTEVTARGTRTELHAADIFDCAGRFAGRFDWIVGRGMFAPFHGNGLPEMLVIMRDALKPGGRLMKTTWHGPHGTPGQTADRLRYGYDSAAEPTPEDLIHAFAAAGFATVLDERFPCGPGYGWREIQNCVFRKT
jgi:SAM-dependent methyltransferase